MVVGSGSFLREGVREWEKGEGERKLYTYASEVDINGAAGVDGGGVTA